MVDSRSCATLSGFDLGCGQGPIAPQEIRPGGRLAGAGLSGVGLATADTTGPSAERRLWEDWSLASWDRDEAEEESNPGDGPEAKTETGEQRRVLRDWDPVPWLLEVALDRVEAGLGPGEFGRLTDRL
jgi:hypothetical protein